MTQRHKHYAIIVAWADGKTIQVLRDSGQWEDLIATSPCWFTDSQYRIKPEPKPDVVLFVPCVFVPGRPYLFGVATGEKTEADNLKITFDGETGKLKSAEVIN